MNLAYLYIHSQSITGPLSWLLNILLVCIVALIVWEILKWVATEFGVPPRITHLIGLLIFVLLVISLFL